MPKPRKNPRGTAPGKTPRAKPGKKRKKVAQEAPANGSSHGEDEPKARPWWALVLALAAVELFVFGSRGQLTVCVGREGEHDFSLLGQQRTDDNTRHYPTCETRLNVGLISRFEEAREEAMLLGCRRATVFRGHEATLQCAVEGDGWSHRTSSSFVFPWDRRYYRRLLWFLF